MMTVPQKTTPTGDIIEAVIAKGDLSKLTSEERTRYYNETCRSLGLNPLTRPFEYITLNGKLTLYARRDCADQLRKINSISVKILSQEQHDGLLTVHVSARDKEGREDEDLGVVNFPDQLRGEARANAILKAVTKAKRRVTLSLSGLGFLDETEIEDIPAAAKRPAAPAPNALLHDPHTGEISDARALDTAARVAEPAPDPSSVSGTGGGPAQMTMDEADAYLAEAARQGMRELEMCWGELTRDQHRTLRVALERRHKPNAAAADEAAMTESNDGQDAG